MNQRKPFAATVTLFAWLPFVGGSAIPREVPLAATVAVEEPASQPSERPVASAIAEPAPAPRQHCATYGGVTLGERGCEEHSTVICATCGDGQCEGAEQCTASGCACEGPGAVCTADCGPLYCPQDCVTRFSGG